MFLPALKIQREKSNSRRGCWPRGFRASAGVKAGIINNANTINLRAFVQVARVIFDVYPVCLLSHDASWMKVDRQEAHTHACECWACWCLKTPSRRFIGVFSQFQAVSTKVFHAPASKKLPPVSRRRGENLAYRINLGLPRRVRELKSMNFQKRSSNIIFARRSLPLLEEIRTKKTSESSDITNQRF